MPWSLKRRQEYYKSPRGRDSLSRYEESADRKESKRLYRQTPKGRAILTKASRDAELRQVGVTERQYQRQLRNQRGMCAICNSLPNGTSLCVDHDHMTGKIRGLLCHACNIGIAKFDDDPNVMRRAIIYLEGS